jgi:hypothetical protein
MKEVVSHEIEAYDYGKVVYLPNPQHRDGNPNKSQWIINTNQEIYVFKYTAYKNWIFEENGWGLFIDKDIINYLGIINNRNTSIFIAKFVVDINHNAWHGYPADYQFKAQDVPDKEVINKWIKEKYITKAKARKIMMGQSCRI